jgi:hypothetical protein
MDETSNSIQQIKAALELIFRHIQKLDSGYPEIISENYVYDKFDELEEAIEFVEEALEK